MAYPNEASAYLRGVYSVKTDLSPTQLGSQYKTWAAMYAEFAKGNAARDIVIDCTTESAAVHITAGSYDLQGATLSSTGLDNVGGYVIVSIDDGTTITGLNTVSGAFNFTNNATTVPIVFSASQVINFANGLNVTSAVSQEMIQATGTGTQLTVNIHDSSVALDSYEVFNILSHAFILLKLTGSSIANNIIRGDATSNLYVYYDATSLFNVTQPNFDGTLVLTAIDLASSVACTDPTTSSSSDVQTSLDNIFADITATGTVTDFSAGDFSPLFTTSVGTSTTTPDLTFNASDFATHTLFGNTTGGSAPPIPITLVEGTGIGIAYGASDITITNTAPGGDSPYVKQNFLITGGSNVGNEYTDWGSMYTALTASNGVFEIALAPGVTSQVPVGAFDVQNAMLIGPNTIPGSSEYIIDDLATLVNFQGLTNTTLESQSSITAWAISGDTKVTFDNSFLQCNGTAEIFTTSGAEVLIVTSHNSQALAGTYEIFNVLAGSGMSFYLFDNSFIGNNCVRDDGTGTVSIFQDASSNYGLTQTNFSGTVIITEIDLATHVVAADPTPFGADNVQDVIDNLNSEILSDPYIVDPANTGTTGNRYQNWTDLIPRLQSGEGFAPIFFDGSSSSTTISAITIGGDDIKNSSFNAVSFDQDGFFVQVNVLSIGLTLPSSVNGPMTLRSAVPGPAAAIVLSGTSAALTADGGDLAANAAELIQVDNSVLSVTCLGEEVINDGYEVINITNGGTLNVSLLNGSRINNDCVRDDGTGTVNAYNDASSSYGFTQTNFSGALATFDLDQAVQIGCTDPTGEGHNNVQGSLDTIYGIMSSQFASYAAGTPYSLTNSPAALTFGTTSPSITLTTAGTYLITARCQLEYNAATFAGNQVTTIALNRANNSSADLTNGTVTATTDIITAITATFIDQTWQVFYTTSNSDDNIVLNGSVTATPGFGSLDATEASIVAVRIQ